MNKRGGEKLLSIWWFLVLGLVGMGIVLGVILFFSADINVKKIESEILTERILNCVIDQGSLIDFENLDFYETCGINKDFFNDEFYFRVFLGGEMKFSQGDSGLEVLCEIKGSNNPKCTKKIVIIEGKVLEVLAASNQKGRGSST